MTPIVLIGPVCVGKSTVGRRLADVLGRPFVDLDDVADAYYADAGRPAADMFDRWATHGPIEAFAWWEPALAHAASNVLRDHPDAVIAFGAGHSHFTDPAWADVVRAELDRHSTTVALLIAHDEIDRAVKMLRDRAIADREMDWILEGVDMLRVWSTSEQNASLATHIEVTAGRTAHEVAESIAARVLRGRSDRVTRGR